MINGKPKTPTFLTIDEQVDRLRNDRKLKIKNESLLKNYLKRHNYENFVNNYSDFLLRNDASTFIDGVTEETLISIFDFDRMFSFFLLRYVFEFERIITTKIAYIIPKFYENKIQELKVGNILGLNEEKFREIFPNPIGVNKKTSKNIYLEKKDLIKYCPKKLLLPNKQYPSLWKISTHWSIGILKKIYKSLNSEVQQTIIDDFAFDVKINLDELGEVIAILKEIRNRICHNKKIYNFRYLPSIKRTPPISYFLYRTKKLPHRQFPKTIRLWHIIIILDSLIENEELIKFSKKHFKDLKKHLKKSTTNRNVGKKIWEDIANQTRYK